MTYILLLGTFIVPLVLFKKLTDNIIIGAVI